MAKTARCSASASRLRSWSTPAKLLRLVRREGVRARAPSFVLQARRGALRRPRRAVPRTAGRSRGCRGWSRYSGVRGRSAATGWQAGECNAATASGLAQGN